MSKQQEQIQQLQNIEQNMQHLLKQKQQFHLQLMEIESALDELKKTEKAYKIIGNIMVAVEKAPLDKELLDKKERIGLRIKSIEKQESIFKEQAKSLREEIVKTMQQDK